MMDMTADAAKMGVDMGITRKFTILHSNDMHGDFLAEQATGGGELIGGLPLLSGYINKVRAEEENVLYVISGDMLQGSIIDSDFKGTSDHADHETTWRQTWSPWGITKWDYGLPHLLFLEKIAKLPHRQRQYLHQALREAHDAPLPRHQDGGLRHPLSTGILTEKVMDSPQEWTN